MVIDGHISGNGGTRPDTQVTGCTQGYQVWIDKAAGNGARKFAWKLTRIGSVNRPFVWFHTGNEISVIIGKVDRSKRKIANGCCHSLFVSDFPEARNRTQSDIAYQGMKPWHIPDCHSECLINKGIFSRVPEDGIGIRTGCSPNVPHPPCPGIRWNRNKWNSSRDNAASVSWFGTLSKASGHHNRAGKKE